MTTHRPNNRRPEGRDAQCWEELTPAQQRAAAWMVDNDRDHKALIREGIALSPTVYGKWGLDNLYQWAAWYKATLPAPPPDPVALIEQALPALTEQALLLLKSTLEKGKGDATAVKAAQWTLEKAYELAKAAPRTDGQQAAMAELEAVLRVVS